MNRLDFLLRGISKEMPGIEIGPYFAPLVPKADGFRSLSLDFIDRGTLVERAKQDPDIAPEACSQIEDVDLIGDAADLAGLVEQKGLLGKCDYVLSSHNFEHLPNPILFLRNCEKVLNEKGFVSMAIPDRRGSFDFFRPLSGTADLLEAFYAARVSASYAQLFGYNSLFARQKTPEAPSSWCFDEDGALAGPAADLRETFLNTEAWREAGSKGYFDIHCFVYIKPSFELVIRELHYLGVIDLGVEEMGGPQGCEFYARLRKGLTRPSRDSFEAKRAELLHEISDANGGNSRESTSLRRSNQDKAARIEVLETQLEKMRRSLSWKITTPFRLLFDRN